MLNDIVNLVTVVIFMILIIMVIKAWMVYKLYHSLFCPYCRKGKLKFISSSSFRMENAIYKCSNCGKKIILFQEYDENNPPKKCNDDVIRVGLNPEFLKKGEEDDDSNTKGHRHVQL